MNKLFRKISRQILTALVLALVIFPIFNQVANVDASAPTVISDTMTRQQVSTLSSHSIVFTESASSQFTAGSTITYDFGTPGFTLAAATTADVTFNDGIARTVVAAGTAPTCTAGANNVTVTTNTGTGVITITACASYTAQAAGSIITFKIGTAAAGTNRLTNPATNGSKKITIAGTSGFVDVGSFAVPILTLDQVTTTATVDPSITSTLSATSCSFGTLSTAATAFCPITNTVNTNATAGYTASVADLDATNPGKLCSPSVATCTNSIPAATTLTYGTSGFGVRTSVAAQTVTNAGACANDTGQAATTLTNIYKQYSSSAGPVANDAPILCYKASLGATQAAGLYTEVSTLITTGNF